MPPKMQKKKKKSAAAADEQSVEACMEGISSMHSWIKANTMIRPTKLGKARMEGEEGSDDEDQTIVILLTSNNPNDPNSLVKWNYNDGGFNNVQLKETMIDHLAIESKIVFVETREAVEQIAKYGIPAETDETEEEAELRLERITHCEKVIEREREKEREMKKEEEEVVEEDPGKMNPNNQFAFIERASQTKVREMQGVESQTDPPPVAHFSGQISPFILHDFFINNEKAMNDDSAEEKKALVGGQEHQDGDVERKLIVSAKLIERLINLNTFDDMIMYCQCLSISCSAASDHLTHCPCPAVTSVIVSGVFPKNARCRPV